MRQVLILGILLGTCSLALAQNSGATGGSAGPSAAGGAGSTLSNGSTINGTGGSPGPNASSAVNRKTTGKNFGTTQTDPSARAPPGNAVNTPAANQATQSLGNTETGILKK